MRNLISLFAFSFFLVMFSSLAFAEDCGGCDGSDWGWGSNVSIHFDGSAIAGSEAVGDSTTAWAQTNVGAGGILNLGDENNGLHGFGSLDTGGSAWSENNDGSGSSALSGSMGELNLFGQFEHSGWEW